MVPIVSFVGKSDVGKTTFLEKVIAELKRRGRRVAVIKHDVHGFAIDQPGKDSWRLAQAGSDVVVISSPDKVALIMQTPQEMSLDELRSQMIQNVDIILTEGYKQSDKPKIEVSRREVGQELLCSPEELLAIVTDQGVALDVPQFGLDDAAGVVDLLEGEIARQQKEAAVTLEVDGCSIPLNAFARSIFQKTILGMVSALRGTAGAREIRLKVEALEEASSLF